VPPGACCMADYFSVIQGAVGELDINTAAARRDIYDRARSALLGRLRAVEPKLPEPVLEAELESLNKAIERVETEHVASRGRFSRERYSGLDTGRGLGLGAAPGAVSPPIPAPPPEPTVGPPQDTRSERRDSLAPPTDRPRRKILAPLLAAVAGLVLAIVVTLGALIYWPRQNREVRASAQTSQAGSASYVYMRQPVFYRTTHPPGTILVDKAQRFAYVVLPNVVALRYGIGVGPECNTAQGLHRITRKEEWPGRAADSGFGKIRNLFAGAREENPLGARALYLQEYRLHGTNAPSAIGNAMPIGCVALLNDSIIEFYDKAPLETRVVFLE
jgi:lipoprotein-anchoring transpeptidase ErfK/SrfK